MFKLLSAAMFGLVATQALNIYAEGENQLMAFEDEEGSEDALQMRRHRTGLPVRGRDGFQQQSRRSKRLVRKTQRKQRRDARRASKHLRRRQRG